MKMKTFRLCVHTQRTYKNQDIVISSKDFPDIKAGDVVELYHPDDEWNRLLLQVKCLPEEYQQKDAVSIEQGIASAFCLRPYNNIIINKVDPKTVVLDLVELLFKEQYFGRSDMWRLCKTLTNTCVYLKKTIEFAEMRTTVNELWARGENVTCGVITEDTRIVFRSPTAVVQIFIQMSSEMWDFDLHGDLYFEKAVNGFLTDLFDKWKDQNCVHDVTIVLFSRTFYEAQSVEDFPPSVRECLQIDTKGRIYEDFYRVIVQNERYEEWSSVLRELRTLFNVYQETVLHYHSHGQQGWRMPKATNSLASQGNFLETLNMSLNLFEKYYLDRNFDRTGKVSVVITPGPGVFEVDRQLANITKQRTIDCGVGSDLVCMGEQPLHAAPLFKFHSKSSHKSIEVGDDYNIPHWMNHSFYMSKNQIEDHMNSSFVPRIKPPPALLKELEEGPKHVKKNLLPRKDDSNDDNIPFVDYDEYDAQVFKLPSGTAPRTYSARGTTLNNIFNRGPALPKTFSEARQRLRPRQRHISDEVSAYMNDHKEPGKDTSAAISIPGHRASHDDMSFSFGCYPIHERAMSRDSYESSESDELINLRPVVGSAGSPVGHSRNLHNYRPHRALINPFAPSRLQFKMTSNRRRWVHAFPVDQRGMQMQARHVHSVSHLDHDDDFPFSNREAVQSPTVTVTTKSKKPFVSQVSSSFGDGAELHSQSGDSIISESPVSRFEGALAKRHGSEAVVPSAARHSHSNRMFHGNKLKIFGSVKSGSEQEWSPDMNTGYDWRPLASDLQDHSGSRLTKSIYRGDIQSNLFSAGITVDWKSLTIPASLPVTTDYFPDRRSLHYDYVVSEYELLPEDVNAEIWASWSRSPSYEDKTLLVYRRAPLNTHEVFLELISQRLGQGFQLITKKKPRTSESGKTNLQPHSSASGFMRPSIRAVDEEYYMSIGRIYHKVTLSGQTVRVTRYWPRHPQPQLHYEYRYRFKAPDSFSYDVSWTNFCNERLENYNWNHLDQYICTGGDWEYGLIDPLRYWRSRFLLMPLSNPATKKITDRETTRCDIYEEKSATELQQLISGFIRFLESMNKMKRPSPQQRKSKADAAASASANNAGSGSGGDSSPRKPDGESGSKEKEERLSLASSSARLVEALTDPIHGLNLFQQQAGLPLNTFISAEAVAWCSQNVAGAESTMQAVTVMQRLMDEQYVLHASGNLKHRFIYGFYLYYIPQRVLQKGGQSAEPSSHPTTHLNTPGTNHNSLFQNEWCEVSVLPVKHMKEERTDVACEPVIIEESPPRTKFYVPQEGPRKSSDSMLVPELEDWRELTGQSKQCWGQQTATLLHKYVNVEVDPQRKSERKEIAMARYHAYYSPKCAFELQIQWMVSTGCVLGDLVYAFARRASSCGFHLMPVPCDPFALPYTENSDPLRGPIFVPLNMTAFEEDLFEDCSDEKRQEMLYIIQDAIIKRFGFLPVSVKVPDSHGSSSMQEENCNHQYVHCTAGMFVLIPESNPALPPTPSGSGSLLLGPLSVGSCSPQRVSETGGMSKKSSTDLHKWYIARQGRPESVPNEVGFLWSWNYMSSRRWRTSNTGDEKFQDTMLADFRKFCSNDENRLTSFWENFKSSIDM
ncbi:GATOR complex protein Iml1 isoform X2 [Aplysia californica]|uniref:GATOR complex protein Iml1 isoform X2 n=1 Tax=Aplysia californica TaxID=6500 RepID=A0ABM0JHE3_APLCA|nr:GATOR complex protein Iml1 isoform X2 [Aplysia californica]